jgi:hypothetical protein
VTELDKEVFLVLDQLIEVKVHLSLKRAATELFKYLEDPLSQVVRAARSEAEQLNVQLLVIFIVEKLSLTL